MSEKAKDVPALSLVGGNLSLDFTNTIGTHDGDTSDEHLDDYADLIAWGQYAQVLSEDEASRLLQIAARRPQEAANTFQRAIALREVMFRIFSSAAAGRSPESADLEAFNDAMCEAMACLQLRPVGDGFDWHWGGREDALERPLWPVVRAAAELLTSDEVKRTRQCAGNHCDWLFLDTSRNHSRRWCKMDECGNRAKARRHYHRKTAIVEDGS